MAKLDHLLRAKYIVQAHKMERSMAYQNLADMFFKKSKELPEHAAYQYKEGSQWHTFTYTEAAAKTERLAAGLISLGIKAGDRVALISHNRPEWAMIDYAVLAIGAVLVTVYPSLLDEQIQYLLNDSESVIVFAEDDMQTDKVSTIYKELQATRHFYIIEAFGKIVAPWHTLTDLEEAGKVQLSADPQCVSQRLAQTQRSDWATIIYTSGTTGEPKGAILTHNNLLSNMENVAQLFKVTEQDKLLSFLPLSHVLERLAGHYFATFHGCTVAYAESVETVPQNILEVRPTIMISVPRLYEKIYAKVLEAVESGSPLKRKIFYWAINVGKQYVQYTMYHRAVPFSVSFKRKIAYKLVFAKLHERMGGRIRFFVSGGAPLSVEIATFFAAAGLLIMEGYGLTETSPAISINYLENYRLGAVGPVLPNQEMKIATDGKVLTRGPHVMVGYYKKEAATKEVFDEEGWFHTGDIGYIDDDGFLFITDRKKNIIVTAGGKNLAPQPIENSLTASKYIEQAVVIGDRRKYCTAVLVLSEEAVNQWLEKEKIPAVASNDYNAHNRLRQLIRKEVDRLTARFPRYEQIKDFYIAPMSFSIETGDLTPSLKVRRKVVEEKYAEAINRMYREGEVN